MKRKLPAQYKYLILLALLTLTAVFASISAFAADDGADIHAVLTGGDGFSYTVDAYRDHGEYILFLPGTCDTSSLTLSYTGNGSITYNGTKYNRGDTFTVDASSGSVTLKSSGEQYKITVMTGGNIPSVYIELDGGDDAFRAVSADKSHEEPGTLSMIETDGSVVYSGELEKFKGHGFTSFVPSWDTNNKNSYNIKLGSKAELIPGSGKIKKWVLLSPRLYDGSRDKTGLSQLLAFHTYTGLVGDEYFGMKGEYVDLYVNGDYRGVYILCERMNNGGAIDIEDLGDHVTGEGALTNVTDSKGNIDDTLDLGIKQYTYCSDATLEEGDVNITGGYVLEVMFEMYEGCGFETKNGVFFNIKSPEYCTQEMVQYIASYVQSFENAIYSETGYNAEGHHYTEYADMKSLADMVLVYAFYQNFEYFRTSTYIYKDADGKAYDKLTFGPVWDFETTSDSLATDNTFFGNANWFVYFNYQQYGWSEQLWQHGDFMALMYSENERMRSTLDELIPDIDTIIGDVSESQEMSIRRWGSETYYTLAKSYAAAVKTRYNGWYNELWGDEYLLYLDVSTVVNDDGTITMSAKAGGTSDGKYMWYVLSSDDPTRYKLHNNHSSEITVPSDGKQYFCTVSGGNNAGLEFAPGEIFSARIIKMRSAPITADAEALAHPLETTPITDPADTQGSGCGSSIDACLVAAALIPAAMIFKRRKEKTI